MSYVKTSLMPDENIFAYGKLHWIVFLPGSAVALLGIILFFSGIMLIDTVGMIIFLLGLVIVIKEYLTYISTELAVTSKRVIAKFGFISRNTIELNHKKVESFHVEQSVFGRILGFGTLIINGTGGVRTPIPSIAQPLEFRRRAIEAIEQA